MLDSTQAHGLDNPPYLIRQDRDDARVLLGVEVGREDTIAQDLVQQPPIPGGGSRCPSESARQHPERRIRRHEERHGLVLGRECRQLMQRGEDGALEDVVEAGVAEGLAGELAQEDAQAVEAAPADSGRAVGEEGREDGGEERPVLADKGFLLMVSIYQSAVGLRVHVCYGWDMVCLT